MLYITVMCILHFMFFANDLLLTIYFIFILDYGNDVNCCCSVTKTCPTLCDPIDCSTQYVSKFEKLSSGHRK